MSPTIVPAPVRKRIIVEASKERAFRVFTEQISAWWPKATHTILKSQLAEVIIEPHVGGRWFHRGVDGSECDTGRVLAWEPPDSLILGWQLNGRWEFEPDVVSEVEIRFTEIRPDTTEVVLEHRCIERFGELAAALSAGLDAPHGWTLLLQLFAKHAGGLG